MPYSSNVFPAVDYIDKHRDEMVTMRDMADLCHLSPGYFSKLFLKDSGENFVDYLNRKKVYWAKERLENSIDTITSIAFSLGYQDTSYFVKVFKKYEGVTPSAYRKGKFKV